MPKNKNQYPDFVYTGLTIDQAREKLELDPYAELLFLGEHKDKSTPAITLVFRNPVKIEGKSSDILTLTTFILEDKIVLKRVEQAITNKCNVINPIFIHPKQGTITFRLFLAEEQGVSSRSEEGFVDAREKKDTAMARVLSSGRSNSFNNPSMRF